MKQKQADRPNWSRVTEKRYFQEYIKYENLEGYLTFLLLDKVTEPLNVRYDMDEICIVDHGYSWIMIVPINMPYSLTIMINRNYEILQWYFDIIHSMELTSEGIPVINDLYLDLVYLANGKLVIKDKDELSSALNDGLITQKTYNMVLHECDKLEEEIRTKSNLLINHSHQYIEKLKTLR